MIYSKRANFPYPVLANYSYEYKDAGFEFDVDLCQNTDNYIFDIEYNISSEFLKGLLRENKARLILVIKSKDNQFHILHRERKDTVEIPRSRLCIENRTALQMMIQATETISFAANHDLNEFYDKLKSDIWVSEGKALGFSNLVTFNGTQKKPYELFERKVDKDLKSDIDIRIGEDTILIIYKSAEMQFQEMPESAALNYPYIYIGLQKALLSFLSHYAEQIEDGLELENIGALVSSLDEKLYSLMKGKKIEELSLENMDRVIYLISDHLLTKYTNAVRGMRHGN